jgi:hypothetical protein
MVTRMAQIVKVNASQPGFGQSRQPVPVAEAAVP